MFYINGEQWRVVIVPPYDPGLLMPDGEFALGACHDDLKTIFITTEVCDEDFQLVLCHELVHAFMFAYNVALDIDDEERLAEIISVFGDDIVDLTDHLFQQIKKRG